MSFINNNGLTPSTPQPSQQFLGNIGRQLGTRPTNIHILQALFHETGTYNDQYRRPYVGHIEQGTMMELMDKAKHLKVPKVTPELVSGTLNNVINISAYTESQNPTFIQNGWQTSRYVFVLRVLIEYSSGSNVIYLVQGFTDYPGINTFTKSVDPNMTMFINNIVELKQHAHYVNNNAVTKTALVSAGHILSNLNFSQAVSPVNEYLLRPMDIHGGIANTGFFKNVDRSNLYDTTSQNQIVPKFSSRANNVPSLYATNVINSYLNTVNNSHFHSSVMLDQHSDISAFSDAMQKVLEPELSRNPFFMALSDNGGIGMRSFFQYRDLEKIDPGINDHNRGALIVVTKGSTQGYQSHTAGSTSHWNGADITTQYAATLSQAVTALMMEHFIAEIAFSVTNQAIGGTIMTIVNVKAFSDDIDARYFESFKQRFINEVLNNISYNNAQLYDIFVSSSVYGETFMKISVENQPHIDYVTPSFSDGLIAPVVTCSQNNVSNLTDTFENVVRNLDDVVSSSYLSSPQDQTL